MNTQVKNITEKLTAAAAFSTNPTFSVFSFDNTGMNSRLVLSTSEAAQAAQLWFDHCIHGDVMRVIYEVRVDGVRVSL